MGARQAAWIARGIRASVVVDHAFSLFSAARSALVLGFASDDVLDTYGGIAYGATGSYRPDSPDFESNLFPFEEQVITRFFPPAPARVLIGGAGGGREALALAKRGDEVVAFDPSAPLIAGLAANVPGGLAITAYHASYEDLPHLGSVLPTGSAVDLTALPRFDAAILGWGSFSHLLSEDDQVAAVRAFAGPVLVSFRSDPHTGADAGTRLARLRRRLPGRNKLAGRHFNMQIGYYQSFSPMQLDTIFTRADLRIETIDTADSSGFWGHAVVSRSGTPSRSTQNDVRKP